MAFNTSSAFPEATAEKDVSFDRLDVLLLIPTLNEENAIESVLREARTVGFANLLVVDGNSKDRTREIAEHEGAPVVLQDFGKGKGCGVRTGMREFLSGKAGYLCIIDGDGTYDPSSLLPLIQLAQSGEVDVVLGSRTRGQREKGAMNALTLTSNLIVSFMLGAKFWRFFTDVQTGYWTFTRSAVEQLYATIRSTGFEIELEIFVTALKNGLHVREVPAAFRTRKGSTKFSFALRLRNLYYAFRFLAS